MTDYKETNKSVEAAEKTVALPSRSQLGETGIQAIKGTTDTPPKSPLAIETPETPETTIIGTPERDAQFWHEQKHPDTCAIVAQEGIIAKHTGKSLGEDALRQEAMQQGWYREEGGTFPAEVGKLLENHNVPIGFHGHGSMEKLEDDLTQGKDAIVGVDAGYLWQDQTCLGEGHAVWVTGLGKDENGTINEVFLNDSGNPEIGGGGKVSSEVFQHAWAARNNFMVTTQDSATGSESKGEK